MRAPRIVAFERGLEIVYANELVTRIRRLTHQQLEFDKDEHDVAKVCCGVNAPVREHLLREHAEPIERQIATRQGELASRNVSALGQLLLTEFETAEHEEIRAFLEALLARLDAIHHPIAKGEIGHGHRLFSAEICTLNNDGLWLGEQLVARLLHVVYYYRLRVRA